MIDFGKILTRAWHILWNYKILWIFGVLLALTSGGGNGGNNGSNYQFNENRTQSGNGFDMSHAWPPLQELANWFNQSVAPLFEHPAEHVATFIWLGVALFVFILIVSIITALIRYPSEVAVMRMVDGYEADGQKVGFRAGWKLGWNRRAFRVWVIDLIVSLPAIVFLLITLILGIIVFVSASGASRATLAGTLIAAIGCFFLMILVLILVSVFLGLLREFFVRFAALEETGIGESLRQGWAFFKRNWKSAAVMWLIMLGIGIGFALAGIIVFFLLIPAYIVLLVPAALIAAIPGVIGLGLTSLFFSGPPAWIVGAIFALPVFFMVLFAPLFLFSGWFKIYASSVWTLTYREMKLLNGVPAVEAPKVPGPTA